jgi:8-oxo-dGTP pyrophosphatase MutT (NUDIX family)
VSEVAEAGQPATIARPRHAASLVLVRRGGGGLQVLMGRRPRRSRFAPDVFVFPGGGVEPADYLATPIRPLDPDCARRTGASPRLAEALAAAALRETAEETGLRLPNDHGALKLLARAITPTMSPIRFHARFFLTEADTADADHADSHELTDLSFRSIEEALALPLMDVTQTMLGALARSAEAQPFLWAYRGRKPYQKALD